ncbi:unnamed protein product [Blepharisma stoltei]|uniref:Histone-lysine N-methyltransferase n=1 Tax=Blepharisma stoltei TaxID=1481888 RepID=A0AAU9JWP0_9CILI|nr:unnamed protein product [Blepharisma stoltei]
MARKKPIDFPEIGNLSNLEYFKLIESGKKPTRNATRIASMQTAAQVLPVPKNPIIKPKKRPNKLKKSEPSPTKKQKQEDIVLPTPPDDELKIRFLEGCVYGAQAMHRKLWIQAGDEWISGTIEEFEEVSGEDIIPARYRIGESWIDLRDKKVYLTGAVVEHQDIAWEVIWNFPGAQSYPQINIRNFEGKTDVVHSIELKDYEKRDNQNAVIAKKQYQAWLDNNLNLEIPDEVIENYYLRFISLKQYKNKVLLLRKHNVTGKLFVYKDKQFRWIPYDKSPITCRLTEPPVPASLLSKFSPGSNLRKQYKEFFLQNSLSFPTPKPDDKTFRKENRCKTCGYILDQLDYRQCTSCGVCYHAQCLEDALSKPGVRGTWRCPDCPRCENCLGTVGKLVRCSDCNSAFHERCLDPVVSPLPGKAWKCELCAVCQHCGIKAIEGNVKWNEYVTKCTSCDLKWRRGEYCSICEKFWFSKKGRHSRTEQRLSTNDYPDMIECEKCQKWVHLLCDSSMTIDLWMLFSSNDNMKYYCPRCKEANLNEEMNQVINDLMNLEKNNFFVKKVDDPFYLKVIKNQMCFEIMIENCQKGLYSNNIELLRDHFKQICENAMCFYKANTIGYQTAEQLLQEGLALLDSKMPQKRKHSDSSRAPTKKSKTEPPADVSLNLPLPTSLDPPVKYDFSAIATQDLPSLSYKSPPNDILNIIINKKDILPYLAAAPQLSFYPTPKAVIYIDPLLCFEELCYLCGSFIRNENIWACHTCGRAFHNFCLDTSSSQSPSDWKCKDCRVCEICHNTQDALHMIYCKTCERAYDVSCLWPSVKGPLQLQGWICDKCFNCRRCGADSYHEPGFIPTQEHFYKDLDICYKCAWVIANKEYCPECERDWSSPYEEKKITSERYYCKPCEFYFHQSCAKDWKGVCQKCYYNNMDYTQAEQQTLEKVQVLMSLISQTNIYKSIAKDCIENRFHLETNFAKLLANAFLIDNADFMANSKEMKELFMGRGVDIVKTKCHRESSYRLTTVPSIDGLRISDIPNIQVPIVKIHRPRDSLPIWSLEWDTSNLMGSIDQIYSPLMSIEIVEILLAPMPSIGSIFVYFPIYIWNFDEITHFMPLPRDPDQYLYERCEWTILATSNTIDLPLNQQNSSHNDHDSLKPHEITQEVLSSELDSEELAHLYINQELPAAIAFAKRFEEWIRENLIKITLHLINSNNSTSDESENFRSEKMFHEELLHREVFYGIRSDDQVEGDRTFSLNCVLCKQNGERKMSGRLLPTDEGVWVHANCAYWSTEVKTEEAGGIMNLNAALIKAKKTKCKECGLNGASLCCISKKCHNSYHFPCALLGRVQLLENKGVLCISCPMPREVSSKPISIESLMNSTHKKMYVTRGKKFNKKPYFIRKVFNRIGSLIITEIPEENEQILVSYRRFWIDGCRQLLKCEYVDEVYRVSVVIDNEFNSKEIMCSVNIEDLWPKLKVGESFLMKNASDFFGYSAISHFLPPLPETSHYKTIKETKPRSLTDIISHLKPSPYGSSSLAPFEKHKKPPPEMPKSSINHKSVNYEESNLSEAKRETSLVPEYRKYRKNPNRDKSVEVLQSNIHGLGLFTNADINPGQIVIEYIGEVVRNRIADLREKEYEEKGIGEGSCYLFRLDEDYVLDATVKGGKARFINHSCQPNCEATTCEIEGEKHILLFAKRLIHKGEEITYDYNFDVESEKIYCHCGAKDCQGKLN